MTITDNGDIRMIFQRECRALTNMNTYENILEQLAAQPSELRGPWLGIYSLHL